MAKLIRKVVYDNIHDAITLTRAESRLMETAYYQRLRWIRQLGFSFYIFPGATHTRFAHAMGVTHIMDKILRSIGKAVPDEKLFNPKANDEKTIFHRTMRIAALLHDIGQFPFSHTIELAYINHWKKRRDIGQPGVMANHEAISEHLILNTDFDGGITKVLKEENIDPKFLSQVISGKSNNLPANQLMHSDVDADRMDYLLRDAHHTGIQLGLYDKDYLINKLCVAQVEDKEVLCVKEEALNTAEYFLICRYSWYSQIINDGTGYKFDLIAAKIYEYFLENGLAYSFDHLLNVVTQNPNEYFTFNDSYFMAKLHEHLAGRINHPMIRELSEMLAKRIAPKQVKIAPIEPILVESLDHRAQLIKDATLAYQWLRFELDKYDPKAWVIFDIPSKDIMFTKSPEALKKELKEPNLLLSRDPVKILTRHGDVKLLIEVSNSLMRVLSSYRNFIPRLYVSHSTYELLEKKGLLDAMKNGEFRN